MKKLNLLLTLIMLTVIACQSDSKDEKTVSQVITEESSVSDQELSDLSIYHLPSEWTTHHNEQIKLEDLKGKALVMVMIYTSCKSACPRLVADMKDIKSRLPEDKLDQLQLVLVSIDPEVDTPERLKEFAIENEMNEAPWLFLRSSESNTREFAAVLAVKYKRISPIDFSHSNIISVFNHKGELVHQKDGLGVNNQETIDAIIELI
ncbi:MAG: SCO family protein [Flavobacteriales bacterium]|nr:SCO family protein [Flavobacteriales bacterium]|tara:strand:+ start:40890 stop:41507 length:618 start_codon:yes stop_codon:yes gene_type:complete